MPGLEYKISITGAGQGAQEFEKLAQASGRVADATGKAAPQAKSLSEALASLGSRNNPAKDALEGISTAARGGEGTIFGLTKAFRAFRELANGGFAALGPGGILVAGLGLVIGLLPKVIELFKGTTKSAEELSKETEAAVKAVEALGKSKLDNLEASLDASQAKAKRFNEELQETLKLEERKDNADKTARIAEIQNSKASDAAKEAQIKLLEQQFQARSDARKLTPLDAIEKQAKAEAEITAKAREDAKKRFDQETARTEEQARNRDFPRQAQAEIAGLRRQTETRVENGKRIPGRALTEQELQRISNLQDAVSETPVVTDDDFKIQQAKSEDAGKVFDEIDKKATAASFRLKSATSAKKNEVSGQKVEAQSRARVTSAELQPKIDELGRAAEEAAARGDFTAQNQAVADRNALLRARRAANPATQPANAPQRLNPDQPARPSTINGQPLQSEQPRRNQIVRGGDLKPASDAVQDAAKSILTSRADAKPLEDSAKKLEDSFLAKASKDTAAIEAAKSTFEKAATDALPPLDLSPVESGFLAYHEQNKQKHAEAQRDIQDLGRRIDQLSQQFANSRR